MEESVWHSGERCERSMKRTINSETSATSAASSALTQSLNPKLETEINIKEELSLNANSFGNASNKREDANTKLSERQLIGSVTHNPLLTETNYINDLEVQENYLRPQNSNMNIKDSHK